MKWQGREEGKGRKGKWGRGREGELIERPEGSSLIWTSQGFWVCQALHCDHALGIPESDGTFTFKTRVKKHPNTSVLQYLWWLVPGSHWVLKSINPWDLKRRVIYLYIYNLTHFPIYIKSSLDTYSGCSMNTCYVTRTRKVYIHSL